MGGYSTMTVIFYNDDRDRKLAFLKVFPNFQMMRETATVIYPNTLIHLGKTRCIFFTNKISPGMIGARVNRYASQTEFILSVQANGNLPDAIAEISSLTQYLRASRDDTMESPGRYLEMLTLATQTIESLKLEAGNTDLLYEWLVELTFLNTESTL